MRTNIARWLCSTIAGLVCVDHLNPVKSTFVWKKSSSRLLIMKNAYTGRLLRRRQATGKIARPDSIGSAPQRALIVGGKPDQNTWPGGLAAVVVVRRRRWT